MDPLDVLAGLSSDEEGHHHVAAEDAALDALRGLDSDDDQDGRHGPVRSAGQSDSIRVARAVLLNLKRRARAAEESQNEAGLQHVPSFHLRSAPNSEKLSVGDVCDVVFAQQSVLSERQRAKQLGVERRFVSRVRFTTLCRYMFHRQAAYNEMLVAGFPAALLCLSMMIKWDETEQVVRRNILVPVVGADPVSTESVSKVHVMVAHVALKTSLITAPLQWHVPPQMLHRTTGECLWAAMLKVVPFGPWSPESLPNTFLCAWLVLAFAADEASSNIRFFHQARKMLQSCRPRTVAFFSNCWMHVLHRQSQNINT